VLAVWSVNRNVNAKCECEMEMEMLLDAGIGNRNGHGFLSYADSYAALVLHRGESARER